VHWRWKARLILLAVAAVVAPTALLPRLPRAASGALIGADQFELISLEPERSDTSAATDFHRHRVLGRTVVNDLAVRRRLAAALRGGVDPIYTSRPVCFSPRLGVRLVADGQTTDFVICFGCRQGQVWQGGRVIADWTTDRTPKAAFDQVLRAAGVPLAADDE
jgi:hypothetical protein